MRNLIYRNLQGWKVLLLFVITGVIYLIMLTITIPKVMGYSGGMRLLDMMPGGYNPAYVNSLLNTLGEKGRDAYLFTQIPVDLIYPLLFGVSYCLVFAYFLEKLGRLESFLFYISYLPLFSGVFDYFENIGIILLLKGFPGNSTILAQTTNVFSVLKSTTTSVFFVLLIMLLIAFAISKTLGKKRE